MRGGATPECVTPSHNQRGLKEYRERKRKAEDSRSAGPKKSSRFGASLGRSAVRTDAWSSWSDSEQEAQTHAIQMVYDDSLALDTLLEFLYTGSYTELDNIMETDCDKRRSDVEWNELLKKHAEVFTLADKYGVATLKKLAGAAINIAAAELSALA